MAENGKVDRPSDFYAEMFKTDAVMTKIRSSLVQQQVRIKNFEEVKLRKQMKRIQKQRKVEIIKDKSEEKRKNTNAINNWKADLQQKKAKDLDEYVRDENKKGRGAKGAYKGKNLGAPADKFKNQKSQKQKKGKRVGKVARIKNRGKMGGKGK